MKKYMLRPCLGFIIFLKLQKWPNFDVKLWTSLTNGKTYKVAEVQDIAPKFGHPGFIKKNVLGIQNHHFWWLSPLVLYDTQVLST
jgi:hypothetical protein